MLCLLTKTAKWLVIDSGTDESSISASWPVVHKSEFLYTESREAMLIKLRD